ncbi:MAG: hypothetical protein K2O08_03325 [Clostridia bacterium]|nr:hypothetical protein [Clostridia bacterium]
MNELKRHKKSDKVRWVLTGITLFLVIIMITGICLQLFGVGKQKPSEWFGKNDQTNLCTVLIEFDPNCTGSGSYSVCFADNDLCEKIDKDNEKLDFSFILIIEHTEKLEYRLADPSHYQDSDEYLSIKEYEKEQNKYIVTFLSESLGEGYIEFFAGEERMAIFFNIIGENFTFVKNGQVL